MLGTVATASAVLAMAAGPPAFGQTAGFDDVPGDAYFSTPITDLSTSGVFGGTLCDDGFCPDEPMDRATMAVWTTLMCPSDNYFEHKWHVPPDRFTAVSAGGFDDWCGIRADQTLTCWGLAGPESREGRFGPS